jgi:hypothetical protein
VAAASSPASVTLGPTPPTISVAAPGSLTFSATQPLETVSPPQTATITNIGSQPISITGLTFTGTDPGDFFIGSDGCLGPIAGGASCSLTVNFAPHATGSRTAALQIASNDPNSPASVSLSGTGGQLPQGPAGTNGTNGKNGATGSRGPRGPSGKVELVTCKTIKKKKHAKKVCTAKVVSHTVTFKISSDDASISRGRTVYATGTDVGHGSGRLQLVLFQRRSMPAGRYTLTLRTHPGHTRRYQITIA